MYYALPNAFRVTSRKCLISAYLDEVAEERIFQRYPQHLSGMLTYLELPRLHLMERESSYVVCFWPKGRRLDFRVRI